MSSIVERLITFQGVGEQGVLRVIYVLTNEVGKELPRWTRKEAVGRR